MHSGSRDSAPLRAGHSHPFRHGTTFGEAHITGRNKRPRFKRARVAGVYPWNDPDWRYHLYGVPCPYYFYQPVCGCERLPCGVGRKPRGQRAYRCH
jgi:hypothetical protein